MRKADLPVVTFWIEKKGGGALAVFGPCECGSHPSSVIVWVESRVIVANVPLP